MCGRGRMALAPDEVLQRTGVHADRWEGRAHYRPAQNAQPGRWMPVIHMSSCNNGGQQHRQISSMRWGLVPWWSKPPLDFFKMFNARSETVHTKPAFQQLLGKKRCVIPLQGFYEWKKQSGSSSKQPYYLHLAGDAIMFVAGLFDVYTAPDGEQLQTFTMITTDSCKLISWLHDRMPALLHGDAEVTAWLEGGCASEAGGPSLNELLRMLRPYPGDDLEWHPVTAAMSNAQYDRPDCCEDVRNKKGSITSFFAKSPPAKRPLEGPPADGHEPPCKMASSPAAAAAAAGSSCAVKDDADGAGPIKEEGAKGAGQEAVASATAGAQQDESQARKVVMPQVKDALKQE